MKLRWLIALGLALFLGAVPALAQEDKDPPTPPRPKLLLVFAPNAEDKTLLTAYKRIEQAQEDLEDSDIHPIYVIGDRPVKLPPPDAHTETGTELRKHYHVDADAFKIVLVGKDGWEKHRWSEPADVGEIMSRASEMPTGKKPGPQ